MSLVPQHSRSETWPVETITRDEDGTIIAVTRQRMIGTGVVTETWAVANAFS